VGVFTEYVLHLFFLVWLMIAMHDCIAAVFMFAIVDDERDGIFSRAGDVAPLDMLGRRRK